MNSFLLLHKILENFIENKNCLSLIFEATLVLGTFAVTKIFKGYLENREKIKNKKKIKSKNSERNRRRIA